MITVIKPKGCKNCKHWRKYGGALTGECTLSCGDANPENKPDGFMVDCTTGNFPFLRTGPDFYCCHFKEKKP